MSAQVIPYVFDDNLVRIVMRDGAPWFVGKDVCRVLNIVDHRQALERLDDDERGRYTAPTPSADQEMIVISEPGVYRLVFTSRKAEAERFKRWLAHEVIPSLRQHGRYAMPEPEAGEDSPANLRPVGRNAPMPEEPIVAGEPLSALRLRLDIIREARLNFGPAHARKLWTEFGLPHSAGRGGEPDHGRALLLRLLQARVKLPGDGAPWSIEDAMQAALNGDRVATKALFDCGIRPDEKHLWIANKSAFLNEIMAGCEDWRRHLLAIPGAHATGPRRIGPSAERLIACGINVPMPECSTTLLG